MFSSHTHIAREWESVCMSAYSYPMAWLQEERENESTFAAIAKKTGADEMSENIGNKRGEQFEKYESHMRDDGKQ